MNERVATRPPLPDVDELRIEEVSSPPTLGRPVAVDSVAGTVTIPTPGMPPAPTALDTARRLAAAVAWASLGFAVLIAVWQLGSWKVPALPSAGDTWTKLKELLSEPFYDRGPNDKGIALRMYSSLQRVFYGFGLAMVVGIPLGFAIGASKRAWQTFNPMIQLLRPVSPLAWFPIWLVVLEDASKAAVWVIFITSLWPTVLNTAAGAAAVPSDQRAVAQVFRFGKLAYLRHVLIPNTLPAIVTGMRVSMGIAWMVIVAVEMLASGGGTGIGSYVWERYNALNLESMVAAIILIGVTGYLLDLIFMRLGRAVAIEEPAA